MAYSRLEQARTRQGASGLVSLSDIMGKVGAPALPTVAGGLQYSPISNKSIALRQLEAKARDMFSDPELRAQAEKIAAGGEVNTDGGIKGVIGDILSPIGSGLMTALDALSIPKRVVIATAAALGNAEDQKNWWKNVTDETYGFKRYVHTGHDWLDSTIGFVGDVAFDPLTYVTLGGAEVAGQGGRFALARAASEATDAATGLKLFSDDAVKNVARYGRSALSSQEAEQLGVRQAGIYLFGNKIRGLDKLGEISEKGLASLRVAAGDTKPMRFLAKNFGKEDFLELRMALSRGEVPSERARQIIRVVTSNDVKRAAAARAQNEGERRLGLLLKEIGDADLNVYGKDLHQLLENPEALAAATGSRRAMADKFIGVFQSFWNDVNTALTDMGEANGFGRIENYFPHMITEDGWKYLSDPTKTYSDAVGELLDNPFDTVRAFKHRKLTVGSEFFGQKLAAADLNVQRLNEIARNGGFIGDFFETDIREVAAKYLGEYSKQMGTVARWKDLADGDVLKGRMAAALDDVLYDPDQVKQVAKNIKGLRGAVNKAKTAATVAVQDALDEIVGIRDGLANQIGANAGSVAKNAEEVATTAARLGVHQGNLSRAEQELRMLRASFAGQFPDGVPAAAHPVMVELEKAADRLIEAQDLLNEMSQREAAAVAEDAAAKVDLKAALDQLPKQEARKAANAQVETVLKTVQKKVESALDGVDDLFRNQQMFAAHYQALTQQGAARLSSLEPLGAEDRKWLETVGVWLTGVDGDGAPLAQRARTTLFGKFNEVGEKVRSIDKYIKGVFSENEYFKSVTSASGLSPSAVANQSLETVRATVNTILSAVDSTPAVLEDAHAGALWLLGADERFFGDQMPEFLSTARDNLVVKATTADRTVALEKGILKGEEKAAASETVKKSAADIADEAAVKSGALTEEQAVARAEARAKLAAKKNARLNRVENSKSAADKAADEYLRLRGINTESGLVSTDSDMATVLAEAQPFVDSYQRLNAFARSLLDRGLAGSTEQVDQATLDELNGLFKSAMSDAGSAEADAASTIENVFTEAKTTSSMDEIGDAANQAETEFAIRGEAPEDAPAYVQDGLRAREEGVTKTLRSITETSQYQKALADATAQPIETYNDLFSVLARVEDAMQKRVWTTGHGGASGMKLSINDLLSKNSLAARMRSVERQAAQAAARNTERVSVHAAALDMAESMTDYMVLSQIHQNFLGVSIALASRKLSVSEEMFQDITRNVARQFRVEWEARALKLRALGATEEEIAKAEAVVARLAGMENEPQAVLHAALLDDVAKRMKVRLETLTPAQTRSVESELATIHGKMQELASDPLFAKATDDKVINDALTELAGADLFRHADPTTGSAAFLVDGVPLLDDAGNQLAFTEEEWRSLFDARTAEVAPEVKAVAATAGDPAELETLVANKAKAVKRITELKAKKAKLGGLRGAENDELTSLQRGVRVADEKIKALQDAMGEVKAVTSTTAVDVRNSASKKFRILVNGNAEQRGWFTKGMDTTPWRVADPEVVKGRVDAVASRFAASTEGKMMARHAAYAAEADRIAAQSTLSSPEHVADAVEHLDEAVAKVSEKAIAEQEAETVVRQTVDPALQSRAEEAARKLQSARSGAAKARRSAASIANEMDRMQSRIDQIVLRAKEAAGRQLPKAEGKVARLQAAVTDAAAKFDAAESVRLTLADEMDGVDTLQAQVQAIDEFLQGVPQSAVERASRRAVLKGRGSETAAKALRSAENTVPPEELDAVMEWAKGAHAALEASRVDPNDPVAVLLRAASEAESTLAHRTLTVAEEEALYSHMEANVADAVSSEVAKTRKVLDAMGLKGMDADPIVVNALTNMQKLRDPRLARQFNSVVGKYTRYFKAYATLSPGFHVRNAVSNAVTLLAADVSPRNMAEGLRIWSSLMAHVKSGKAIEEFIAAQPAETRGLVDVAVRAFEAAGGGRVEEAFSDLLKSKSSVSDWWLLRKSRYWGERVDGSGRFIMAYDAAVKGADFNRAAQKVQRFLVDYMDTSRADKALKNVIPFWMWTSRNVPLHITNRFMNPRVYNIYQSFMNNVGMDDSGEVVPSWLKERGAVKIAANWYLAPDLGFTSLRGQVNELKDPARLAKYVNPLLRVPVELVGGRKLYNNVPFSDRPQTPIGGQFGGEILGRLGLAQRVGPNGVTSLDGKTLINGGDWGMSDKMLYALMNLNPTLGQAERLFPSSETYKDRQLGSFLSWAGLPFSQVTAGSRDSEARRRQREMEALKRIATTYGYTP